jgi:hypothetical protein
MTALQQIIKEAKILRKKNPKMEWKKAVAQASAIYSSKHKGKSPVGKKHKKVVRKKAAKKVGTIKRKVAKKKKPSEQSILNKIHRVKHDVERLDEAQHKHMMSGLHKIVGSVSGKYYINYTTDSGYKKMEFFNKLPKGYYKGKDRVLYVTRLTHSGTSLIPIKYTDNNKEVKK